MNKQQAYPYSTSHGITPIMTWSFDYIHFYYFHFFFRTTSEMANLGSDLYQTGTISILFGMEIKKYHSLVSYRKVSFAVTLSLCLP